MRYCCVRKVGIGFNDFQLHVLNIKEGSSSSRMIIITKSMGDPHLPKHNSSHKWETKDPNSQMHLNIWNDNFIIRWPYLSYLWCGVIYVQISWLDHKKCRSDAGWVISGKVKWALVELGNVISILLNLLLRSFFSADKSAN